MQGRGVEDRPLGDRLGISQDLEVMAALRAASGSPEPAARLWAAEALREEIGAAEGH